MFDSGQARMTRFDVWIPAYAGMTRAGGNGIQERDSSVRRPAKLLGMTGEV